MLTFAGLCRDLFLMSFAAPYLRRFGGEAWEACVGEYLALRSARVDVLPGGCQVFGVSARSGLRHQVDAALGASDALVVVECKAYRSSLPKNDLLKFKAITDDFYMSIASDVPRRPLFRLFGGPGDASTELRRYAAYHGIVIIERDRWPAAYLAAGEVWINRLPIPEDVVADLARLSRPMQRVLRRVRDGSFRLEPPLRAGNLDTLIALHDRWSDWLWTEIDRGSGCFELMLEQRFAALRAAA